jgi:hypothetical protein
MSFACFLLLHFEKLHILDTILRQTSVFKAFFFFLPVSSLPLDYLISIFGRAKALSFEVQFVNFFDCTFWCHF